MNDPVYQQAAEALAGRMIRDSSGKSLDDRLNHGAQLVLSRNLTPAEMAPLRRLYGHFSSATSGYTAVASAFLNLDAALTR